MSQAAAASTDYLGALNPAQRLAVTWGDRACHSPPLLVIAGAGTGKTLTLAHRVAHLIIHGISPERILLLTFTRRAAQEMSRRVEAIVREVVNATDGPKSRNPTLPWSGTFHSIANRLIRRYAANLELDPGFSVLDRSDSADIMDLVRHELKLSRTSQRFPTKDTCLAIYSRCVNTKKSLAACLTETFPWCVDWQDELRKLFLKYVERKQATQALDYDDLLLYWNHLVSDRELAEDIGSWFDHVLVDEYQDTNVLQAEILKAIKPEGSGLTVVGDDAQSIYSFRAAAVDNILEFADQYSPPAKTVMLEQNYRSSQPILDCANCLIAESERQYRKSLYSEGRSGGKPRYVTVEDCDAEAEFVVNSVLANREQGVRLMDQAVLFRGSHSSDRLELELVRRKIPYVKYGGLKFLEAAHVKDLLSILKWAENPRNQVAAFRILKLLPGMGPASATRCFHYLSAGGFHFSILNSFTPPPASRVDWPCFCSLMESLSSVGLDDPAWQLQLEQARNWYQPHLERLYDGLETREADLEQLQRISGNYPTRERFLTELTLDPPSAVGDLAGDPLLDEDYLVLSTVHSAKGQEWNAVFVLNVSDGSFPSEFSTASPAMIEEERRLLYVAMTRAKQELQLMAPLRYYATQQHRHGDRHVYGARSRFVTDSLLKTMEKTFHARNRESSSHLAPRSNKRLGMQRRLREMWQG